MDGVCTSLMYAGVLRVNPANRWFFMVKTVYRSTQARNIQHTARQMVPIETRLFRVKGVGMEGRSEPS